MGVRSWLTRFRNSDQVQTPDSGRGQFKVQEGVNPGLVKERLI